MATTGNFRDFCFCGAVGTSTVGAAWNGRIRGGRRKLSQPGSAGSTVAWASVAWRRTSSESPAPSTSPTAHSAASWAVSSSPSSREPLLEPRSVTWTASGVTAIRRWRRDSEWSFQLRTPLRPASCTPTGSPKTRPASGPPTTWSWSPEVGSGGAEVSTPSTPTRTPSRRPRSPTGPSAERGRSTPCFGGTDSPPAAWPWAASRPSSSSPASASSQSTRTSVAPRGPSTVTVMRMVSLPAGRSRTGHR